jgi:uncharacterized tellurite resistance protein B-like protein
MFSKLKKMIKSEKPQAVSDDLDPLQYAAAVLLFEVAAVDGHIAEDEEVLIAQILSQEFGLSSSDGTQLQEAAKTRAQSSVQLLPAVSVINKEYSETNKEHLFELLWQVVLSDGQREDHESALMRRLAGLLYVSDKASGTARRRALQKLGKS